MPEPTISPLPALRIPTHPDHPLHLDNSPLQILSPRAADPDEEITSATPPSTLTPAIAIATILYNWHPDALLAFLDTTTWVTFTWNVKLGGGDGGGQIEVGRVRGRVMVGELDGKEEWRWGVAWDMACRDGEGWFEGWFEGSWVVDCRDSVLDSTSAEGRDPEEVQARANGELWEWICDARWETGRKVRHDLFVESAVLGVDAWSDGLRISPHWLYRAMDLGRCTFCGRRGDGGGGEAGGLRKCGKCGTATYCGVGCQRGDWKVHKGVCGMGLEERGKGLFYSRGEGGLAGAGAGVTVGEDGDEQEEEEEDDDDEYDDEDGPTWVVEGGSRSAAELRNMPAKLSEREVKETVDMMEQMMREASRR